MGWVTLRLVARGRDAIVFCAVAGACVWCHAAMQAKTNAWQEALDARQAFEAEPAGEHSKAEYSAVMDDFRAIYHGNPSGAHAGRAVEQVAELLAEQGRELKDGKSLRDAAGQYEFLAKAYPGGSLASSALGHALELLGPEAANDAAEARKVEVDLRTDYPRSAEVKALNSGSRVESAAAGSGPVSPAVETGAGSVDAGRTTSRHRTKAIVVPPSAEDAVAVPAPVVRKSAEDAEPVAVVASDAAPVRKHMAQVTGIRHWSTATYTRVAIDLGDEVEYQAARVEHPDRIFFDLHNARLAQELVGKSFAVTDDGFLVRIRAAQFSNDVTRVVLDVHEVAEYSAFLLPNPYRLIIDIHGKKQGAISSEQLAANSEAAGDDVAGGDSGLAAQPAPSLGVKGTEVSALPPMPVTDGSVGFGLPARKAAGQTSTTKPVAVAQPRVVISAKPTAAKPVPNTVTTRAGDNGLEVAAVSQQQGKVEATSRPTSQPIVARSSEQDSGSSASMAPAKVLRGKGHGAVTQAHVDGAPVDAPPPTADGETSLVRALGLKIGRIVIDAGHGGHDSGTLGAGGIEEKDVVLDVALRLGKLLHDRLGAEIVYTRADDTFIPLETRTAIANKAQADLFISIHANSSQDASARGVEVYYLNFTSDPDAMKVASRENAVSTQSVHELSDLVKKIALKDKIDESKELASDVDESLYSGIEKGNEGLKNRGVKKAPFVVLIGANMPSILAEISFVTNPQDAEELERPAYRERVAESLYNGVARYAGGINGAKPVRTTERAAR
jgi:N-acetylmuramoyl-L-alanine amidase